MSRIRTNYRHFGINTLLECRWWEKAKCYDKCDGLAWVKEPTQRYEYSNYPLKNGYWEAVRVAWQWQNTVQGST